LRGSFAQLSDNLFDLLGRARVELFRVYVGKTTRLARVSA
jgi:hypothetical protein